MPLLGLFASEKKGCWERRNSEHLHAKKMWCSQSAVSAWSFYSVSVLTWKSGLCLFNIALFFCRSILTVCQTSGRALQHSSIWLFQVMQWDIRRRGGVAYKVCFDIMWWLFSSYHVLFHKFTLIIIHISMVNLLIKVIYFDVQRKET